MIHHYAYCGISECNNGSKRIWGAAQWVGTDGFTGTYVFWGSPKNPLVKKYAGHSKMSRSERLGEKIERKKRSYSGYREIKTEDVRTALPELESQIGMHILVKKLKFA